MSYLPKIGDCLKAFYAGDTVRLRELLSDAPAEFFVDINGANGTMPVSRFAELLVTNAFRGARGEGWGASLDLLDGLKCAPEKWAECLSVLIDAYEGRHDFRVVKRYVNNNWTSSASLVMACVGEIKGSDPDLLGAAHAMLDIAMKEPFGIRDPDELDHLIKIASADVLRKILHSPNVRFEHLQPEHKFEEASLHAASFGSIAALEYFESKGLDFSKRKLAWVRREWVSGSVAKEEMNWGYPLNSAKDVAVAEWLVQRGCDPNFREIGVSGGGTPLFNAIANKDLAMVRWYVEKQGASLTVRDDRGYTPLLYACATGGVKELKYLVEKGADLNALLPDGSNAAFACTLGYSSGVGKRLEYLSSKGVALDRPNAAGVYYTSKIRTAADKKFMVAEVVRRHEAGQPLFQPFVRSLWRQLTTSRSNAEGMYRLVRSGALDVSYFRAGQTNPLHSIVILNPYDSLHEVSPSLAGVSATTEIASELLAAGLRIDLRNERGYTPLMEAVSHKNLKAVRFLMEMGANPDIKSLKGKPLSSLTRTDSVRRELISDELARSLESALGDVACGSSNEDVADVDRSSPSSSGSFGML